MMAWSQMARQHLSLLRFKHVVYSNGVSSIASRAPMPHARALRSPFFSRDSISHRIDIAPVVKSFSRLSLLLPPCWKQLGIKVF